MANERQKFTCPVLTENPDRFVVGEPAYKDIWAMYKLQLRSFWTPEEIIWRQDIEDWEKKLNDDQRHFIKHILAFFAVSDGVVI